MAHALNRIAPASWPASHSVAPGVRTAELSAILPLMAIDVVPLILLPTMDPERFERCSFALQDAVSLLTITMAELPPFIIHFHKLRWHRVTPLAQCTPVLTQGCQMAVAEVLNSP